MVRVISISDEVYMELSAIKNGRSFTEVIKSLVEGKEKKVQRRGDIANLEKFFGIISKKDGDAWQKEVLERRRASMPREF